jgi:hypothetical protein
MWAAHFPLDTATISVLGEEKGVPALERWNAPSSSLAAPLRADWL